MTNLAAEREGAMTPELKPCPFCGARMMVREHSAFHPGGTGLTVSDCWLADYELDEQDYRTWNRRSVTERAAVVEPNVVEAAERVVEYYAPLGPPFIETVPVGDPQMLIGDAVIIARALLSLSSPEGRGQGEKR